MEVHNTHDEQGWRVTLAETGVSTLTGGRVRRAARYLGRERFMVTYGDGVSDIDLSLLLAHHESQGRLATVTAVRPMSRFGQLDVDGHVVQAFREKPQVAEGWINGGLPGLRAGRARSDHGGRREPGRRPALQARRARAARRLPARRLLAVHGHLPRDGAPERPLALGHGTLGEVARREVTSFWSGRRVLVTGHTGFKGGWLAAWLAREGSVVTGLALPPPRGPASSASARWSGRLTSLVGDVRDAAPRSSEAFASADPEVMFHLAAQPLVRRGYAEPVLTFETNVMGTVNVLEAARAAPSCARWSWSPATSVTSRAAHRPHARTIRSAATTPTARARRRRRWWSAPTACRSGRPGPGLASVRAGNVIGGGDWNEFRVVPDAVRAFSSGRPWP